MTVTRREGRGNSLEKLPWKPIWPTGFAALSESHGLAQCMYVCVCECVYVPTVDQVGTAAANAHSSQLSEGSCCTAQLAATLFRDPVGQRKKCSRNLACKMTRTAACAVTELTAVERITYLLLTPFCCSDTVMKKCNTSACLGSPQAARSHQEST